MCENADAHIHRHGSRVHVCEYVDVWELESKNPRRIHVHIHVCEY